MQHPPSDLPKETVAHAWQGWTVFTRALTYSVIAAVVITAAVVALIVF